MYRYIADNAVTYTSDDLDLFRESPFALWMERLTLENPDHGIPADREMAHVQNSTDREEDLVSTLRAEGRHVVQIDRDQDEAGRRAATVDAMRDGADFIVNGQLAVDCLSGNARMLMRTSGYSELGDYLYTPCETNARNTLQSAFRLCFVADLLHNLQGQLPPQMLLIRDGAEVVPLQTEDYIYYYRAVQKRFVHAMQNFRKHRMPDPAESSHFGRWSECASEVLRQRALSEQQRAEEQALEESSSAAETREQEPTDHYEVPQLKVAASAGTVPGYDNEPSQVNGRTAAPVAHDANATLAAQTSHIYTLAEQARLLQPGSFRTGKPPGHTPNLAHYGRPRAVPDARDGAAKHKRRSSDAALENLEFIGSSPNESVVDAAPPVIIEDGTRPAPTASLREPLKRATSPSDEHATAGPVGLPELEPRTPVFLPPEKARDDVPTVERRPVVQQTGEKPEMPRVTRSVIDLDNAPAPGLAPVVQRAEAEFERLLKDDPVFRNIAPIWSDDEAQENSSGQKPAIIPFSNSLMTSDEFSES